MSGRLRQSMWTVCGILLLVLVAGCGPRPKRDPRRTPRRPAKPLHVEPYAGVLSDEPALAAALDRLPAALEDAELQAGGALGIALDRRDRVRVTVEEGAGRPGAYSLSQVWRDRIRTWRVAIHSEPLVRGDGDLDRAVRAALTAAMLAEQEFARGVTLPEWVRAGAPSYTSREGDRRRLERLFGDDPEADPDPDLIGHARWLYLERTFGPRRLASFLPALLLGRSEEEALEEVFGRPARALDLEWALFEKEWLARRDGDRPPARLDARAFDEAERLRENDEPDAAVVAWRRFLLLFPDSGLVDRARIALARLELSLGNANQVLLDLAEAVDEARGTTGTTLRGLAFEAACRLARDGRAAAILAREIELNGADEATAERAAALVARETEPLPPLTLREAETALATLDAPGRADEDRAGARDALERIGRRAVPLIADRIDSRPRLARESVPILEALGGEAARAVLERLAFEAAPDTAGEAVRALLRLGADAGDLSDRLLGATNAWPALRALRDATGRADAELLRKIPDLAVRLASPDPEVRALLADRLGDTGHAAAATPLGVLARGDDDPMVRLAALRALGRLGEAGVEMLLTLLDDARGPSRMSALGVLLEVAPERAAGRLPTIMDGAEPRIRAAILTIWSGRGAPGWAPEAVARLGDSDPGVRRVAETVLVKGEAADAVPAILLAYESETVDAARATRLARALGSRAGRDFGHAPGFDHAARRTVAERMRAWWVAARRE